MPPSPALLFGCTFREPAQVPASDLRCLRSLCASPATRCRPDPAATCAPRGLSGRSPATASRRGRLPLSAETVARGADPPQVRRRVVVTITDVVDLRRLHGARRHPLRRQPLTRVGKLARRMQPEHRPDDGRPVRRQGSPSIRRLPRLPPMLGTRHRRVTPTMSAPPCCTRHCARLLGQHPVEGSNLAPHGFGDRAVPSTPDSRARL